jgi:hypothetical protein
MIQFVPKKPLANSRNTLDFGIVIFWNWPYTAGVRFFTAVSSTKQQGVSVQFVAQNGKIG